MAFRGVSGVGLSARRAAWNIRQLEVFLGIHGQSGGLVQVETRIGDAWVTPAMAAQLREEGRLVS